MNRKRWSFLSWIALSPAILSFLFIVACATTGVGASGASTYVRLKDADWNPSGCQELGEVSGRDGPSATPSPDRARIQAVHKAVNLGATDLMTKSSSPVATSQAGVLEWVYKGVAYRCPPAPR